MHIFLLLYIYLYLYIHRYTYIDDINIFKCIHIYIQMHLCSSCTGTHLHLDLHIPSFQAGSGDRRQPQVSTRPPVLATAALCARRRGARQPIPLSQMRTMVLVYYQHLPECPNKIFQFCRCIFTSMPYIDMHGAYGYVCWEYPAG